ncbi:Putative Holin-X, holin superfamily III [Streptomyces sp. TverLS-915]|uniref:DUF6251 family protein n=1 Tax=Streptomyces sp. TverLS-915 TaxID=1839763 RepID=UPI00081D456E|nr:Putative Holin-X, holin superfamily III [Streptomyces sp. TverLS-915]
MDNLPRRYRFDNAAPTPTAHHTAPLPLPAEETTPAVLPVADDGTRVVVQHIHQAPPDRTVQRLAVGAGMGGGALAAGVYFGPLLVAALTSIAVSLAVVALVVVAVAWGLSTATRSLRHDNPPIRRPRRR